MNLFELYLLVTRAFLSFLFDLKPRSLQSSSEKTSGEWLWHSQVGWDRQTGLFVFQLTLWTLQAVQSKQQKDTETRMWCRFFVNYFNIYRYSIFSHRLLMFIFLFPLVLDCEKGAPQEDWPGFYKGLQGLGVGGAWCPHIHCGRFTIGSSWLFLKLWSLISDRGRKVERRLDCWNCHWHIFNLLATANKSWR